METRNKYKIDLRNYKINKEIQVSKVNSIYSVQNIKTKTTYAAKIIKNEEEGEIIKKMNNYSFNNIFLCNHPTLVRYYGYSTVDFNGDDNITLITELLTNLPLSSYIEKAQNGILNISYKNSRQIILLGIARGMMYLEKNHILHRNLNPSNIFLDDHHHPLIINYGFSNIRKISQNLTKLNYKELIYMAPEILSNNHYNMKSNVYSFGIIMFEVLTETSPYPLFQNGKMSSLEFIQKIINEDFHPKFSTPLKRSFKKLIKRCLSKNPNERPTFDEIFNMLAYNIEDSIFDTNDDANDYDHSYYLDNTENDELYEYIDLITKNDLENSTVPLKDSIDNLKKDNEYLKKENEQMIQQINLLKKQNVQIAQKFEKFYSDSIAPLENTIEQLKKENDKMKKIISKFIKNRKDTSLEISPPEAPKLNNKKLGQTEQNETSWDDFDDSKDSDKNNKIKKIFDKDFSDDDSNLDKDDYDYNNKNEKVIRKRSYSLKGIKYTKNAPLIKLPSKSDNEDFYEVNSPKSARPTRSLRVIRKAEIKSSNSDEERIINDFNDTKIDLDRFNKLPLRFQQAFVSEYLRQSPEEFNQDLMLIKDLLNYLLQFHESINSIHYIAVTTNKTKERYSNANEWCQNINEIQLLPAAAQILYLNNSLDKKEFIEIIKQFKNVSIEIKYPSENFTKIFRIITNIKNSYVDNLKITISLSNIAASDDTFRKNKDITSIKFDSTVLYIGQNSFRDCSSLEKILISSSVQSIEYGSFRKCTGLTKVSIPSSVTTIGEGSFSRCTALQKIKLPDTMTKIEQWAFSACTSLKEITIPKSVTVITVSCFSECTSLAKVNIPSSVTMIENRAFHRCTSLKSISLPSSIISLGEGVFSKCFALSEIKIPSTIKILRKQLFAECSSLENVTIPSSVDTIEDQAFEGCFSLSEVTIPSSVTSLGFWAFPSNTIISTIDEKKIKYN